MRRVRRHRNRRRPPYEAGQRGLAQAQRDIDLAA
jgi:hypothetical protein